MNNRELRVANKENKREENILCLTSSPENDEEKTMKKMEVITEITKEVRQLGAPELSRY